jgi:hypothetical protein
MQLKLVRLLHQSAMSPQILARSRKGLLLLPRPYSLVYSSQRLQSNQRQTPVGAEQELPCILESSLPFLLQHRIQAERPRTRWVVAKLPLRRSQFLLQDQPRPALPFWRRPGRS